MTDQPTPETDAEMFLRPRFRFNPADMAYKFARALEIQRNAARADAARLLSELADERAKKSDALIAAVDDIERLTAERDTLRETAHDNSVFWSARDGTGELQHYKASPVEASKLIVALGNERDALRAALNEYGEHQGVCPKKYHGMKDSRPCTCGLDEALATSAK